MSDTGKDQSKSKDVSCSSTSSSHSTSKSAALDKEFLKKVFKDYVNKENPNDWTDCKAVYIPGNEVMGKSVASASKTNAAAGGQSSSSKTDSTSGQCTTHVSFGSHTNFILFIFTHSYYRRQSARAVPVSKKRQSSSASGAINRKLEHKRGYIVVVGGWRHRPVSVCILLDPFEVFGDTVPINCNTVRHVSCLCLSQCLPCVHAWVASLRTSVAKRN